MTFIHNLCTHITIRIVKFEHTFYYEHIYTFDEKNHKYLKSLEHFKQKHKQFLRKYKQNKIQ